MTKRILVPRDLDDKARDLWHDTLTILRDRAEPPLVPESDLPWLEQYCRSHMQARHALGRILAREKAWNEWVANWTVRTDPKSEPERGWQTFGAQKQQVQHPDVKTMDAALKHANDVARELLLPPKTRKAADIQTKAGDGGKFGL